MAGVAVTSIVSPALIEEPAKGPTPLASLREEPSCDLAPTDVASGAIETDSEGVPTVYVVAQGDSAWGISERLCVDDIMAINGIDRWLQPGERLVVRPIPRLP